MNKIIILFKTFIYLTNFILPLATQNPRKIMIRGNMFLLDGVPLQILSGSIHYFRVPGPYWRNRLLKLKAAGLNTVSTYVEWSYHEPEERQYEFTGDRDVAHFIRLAAAEGLHVLLRPGPYICAERDLGGLPYWLLSKYPNIRLRSKDEDFMKETKIWFDKLFEQLSPLLYGNDGPIIMVQVENEYSLYGSGPDYMVALRDTLRRYVGRNALLYTAEAPQRANFMIGAVDGALTTINFGSGSKVPQIFNDLRQYMPHGPLMNSEYYSGWLTHWGKKFQRVNTNKLIRTMRDMLDNKNSFNIYMFHGGTNFEFTSGANFHLGKYQPDITSYDYDAPLNEAGDCTVKYFNIRNTIAEYFPEVEMIPLPEPTPVIGYGSVALTNKVNLLSPEGRKKYGLYYGEYSGDHLPTFEALRQRSGLMLYETKLNSSSGKLVTHLLNIDKPRDRIYVFIDGLFKGIFSRMHDVYDLPVELNNNSRILSLLVENQGRINYGPKLHDFKGILSPIKLNQNKLSGAWSTTGFPLENILTIGSTQNNTKDVGPAFYEGLFTLPKDEKPLDTFLDPSGWGKGYIWMNGYNLGRYWPSVGPQVTLYVPGAWLHAAPLTNTLQILELETPSTDLTVEFIDHPILELR